MRRLTARSIARRHHHRLGVLAVAGGLAVPIAAQTSAPGISAQRPDQNPGLSRHSERPVEGTIREGAAERAIRPFVLTAVTLDGSSLSADRLAAVYQPFIGQTIDSRALSRITDAVAEAYAASDIALYTVLAPDQSFAGGALRLVAVEGYVAAVEVRGTLRAVRRPLLRAYLRRLERERPLHTSTLQRVVSLIRDVPGLFTELAFQKGTRQGAVKLLLTAREKPIQLSFGVNDRGTALLGKTQVQTDAYINGILSGADQFHATLILPTRVSRFQYYAGAYLAPLGTDGTTAQVNLGSLRTRPPVLKLAERTIRLQGRSLSFGGQISRPLLRTYRRSLSATIGFDGVDSDNALLGFVLSNDRVRALRTALAFGASSPRNQLTISGTASFGIAALGARVVAGQAESGFRKLNVKLAENRQLGRDFVLRLAAFGQATDDRLPGSEQIALGGDEFGRAYEAALIAGDRGYAGSAEFAWRPPDGLPKPLAGSEFYAFTDAGRVWYRGRFGFATGESHLASIGTGARLRVAARGIVQLELVRGLDNPVFYEDRKKWRVLFSLRSSL